MAHPVGRPTKYQPEFCQEFYNLRADGHSVESACDKMGISKTTLYEWARVYPEFLNAVEAAKNAYLAFFEKIGINAMIGKVPGFQSKPWELMYRNAGGIRDKIEIEVKSGISDDKLVEILKDEGLRSKLQDVAESIAGDGSKSDEDEPS